MSIGKKPRMRCSWAGNKSHMVRYHDREWGKLVYHDRRLYEMLILKEAQVGPHVGTSLSQR